MASKNTLAMSTFGSSEYAGKEPRAEETQEETEGYPLRLRFGHICIAICYILDPIMFCSVLPKQRWKESSDFFYCIGVVGMTLPVLYMQIFLGQYTKLGCLDYGLMVPLIHGLGSSKLLVTFYNLLEVAIETGLYGNYAIMTFKEPWKTCKNSYKECVTLEDIMKCSDLDCQKDWSDLSKGKTLSSFNYFWEIYSQAHSQKIIIICLCCIIACFLVAVGHRLFQHIVLAGFISLTATSFIMMIVALTLTSQLSVDLEEEMESISNQRNLTWKGCFTSMILSLLTMQAAGAGHMIYGTHLSTRVQASVQTIIIGLMYIICIALGGFLYRIGYNAIIAATHWPAYVESHLTEEQMLFVIMQEFMILQFEKGSVFPIFFNASCLLLGFSKQIIHVDVICETLISYYPSLDQHKAYLVAAVTLLTLLCLIPFFFFPIKAEATTKQVIKICSVFIIEIEIIGVAYFYSYHVLSDDIHYAFGAQPAKVWKCLWLFGPILVPIGVFLGWKDEIQMSPTQIAIVILTLLPILIGAFYKLYIYVKGHNALGVFMPEEGWGMRSLYHRKLRQMYNPREETNSQKRAARCKHNCLLESDILYAFIAAEIEASMSSKAERKLFASNEDESSNSSSDDQVLQLPKGKRSFYSDLSNRRGF